MLTSMFFVSLLSTVSWSAEPVDVDAAVLAAMPHEYDGMRIRTEMSKSAVLTHKVPGCSKENIPIMLGPKMRAGVAPAVTTGLFILCIARDEAVSVIPLPMGTGLVMEADLNVDGPRSNPRVTMTNAVIVSKIDMNTGEPLP